jgi:hypothetical protein
LRVVGLADSYPQLATINRQPASRSVAVILSE